ncbi:MAG: 3-keto-disaccharide hydrolase [Planctomycetaceae bacterium]
MRLLILSGLVLALSPCLFAETPLGEAKSLFNGENLDGWRGRSDLWSVTEGAIVGTTTDENPIQENTFLIYDGELPSSFELRAQFMIRGGNSGIQYRSRVVDEKKFVVAGYQADIDDALKFAGINYEEKGRGILALRGERTTIGKDGTKTKEVFGDAAKIGEVIRAGQWNNYRVVANGNRLQHYINDELTSEVIDGQTDKAATNGVIALQLHKGPAMVVKYKGLQIRPITQ